MYITNTIFGPEVIKINFLHTRHRFISLICRRKRSYFGIVKDYLRAKSIENLSRKILLLIVLYPRRLEVLLFFGGTIVTCIPIKLVGKTGTGNKFTARAFAILPKNLFCLDLGTKDSGVGSIKSSSWYKDFTESAF